MLPTRREGNSISVRDKSLAALLVVSTKVDSHRASIDTKAGILLEYVYYTSTDVWDLHNYADRL